MGVPHVVDVEPVCPVAVGHVLETSRAYHGMVRHANEGENKRQKVSHESTGACRMQCVRDSISFSIIQHYSTIGTTHIRVLLVLLVLVLVSVCYERRMYGWAGG